jgi:hypothetical protein
VWENLEVSNAVSSSKLMKVEVPLVIASVQPTHAYVKLSIRMCLLLMTCGRSSISDMWYAEDRLVSACESLLPAYIVVISFSRVLSESSLYMPSVPYLTTVLELPLALTFRWKP